MYKKYMIIDCFDAWYFLLTLYYITLITINVYFFLSITKFCP